MRGGTHYLASKDRARAQQIANRQTMGDSHILAIKNGNRDQKIVNQTNKEQCSQASRDRGLDRKQDK